MLMPAAVLVLVTLGAITVDMSLMWLGERELANTADAAATSAAAVIDDEHYRRTGEVTVRCDTADEVATAAFEARRPDWLRTGRVEVVECMGNRVRVEATAEVGFVFSRAIPGARDRGRVAAAASATAERRP